MRIAWLDKIFPSDDIVCNRKRISHLCIQKFKYTLWFYIFPITTYGHAFEWAMAYLNQSANNDLAKVNLPFVLDKINPM